MKTLDEIGKDVDEIVTSFMELQNAIDKVIDAGCMDIEGLLYDKIYRAVESAISAYDPEGWIFWYVFENDMGKGKKEAGYDGKLKKIENTKDLAQLIHTAQNK